MDRSGSMPEPFEIVAQRSTGCVYVLTGAQRHVLPATSEGQAGIMAASLQECLERVIAYPYWQEVLCFGKGDLPKMRQVLRDRIEEYEEEALGDNPEIEEFRPLLRARLGLTEPRDSLKLLHGAWHRGDRSRSRWASRRAAGWRIQKAMMVACSSACHRESNRLTFPLSFRAEMTYMHLHEKSGSRHPR
jgi:hypothetical protein